MSTSAKDVARERRPWRRCSACLGVCHWHDDAWVCDDPENGCGSEWYPDHNPARYGVPGDPRPRKNLSR